MKAESANAVPKRTGSTSDRAADPALRLGGIALANGLAVVSSDNWAAAIREQDGTISVASGKKPRVGAEGVPLVRGLSRFAETLLVLGVVKQRLPGARLPFEDRRIAAALAASMAGASAVRAMAPRSARGRALTCAFGYCMHWRARNRPCAEARCDPGL